MRTISMTSLINRHRKVKPVTLLILEIFCLVMGMLFLGMWLKIRLHRELDLIAQSFECLALEEAEPTFDQPTIAKPTLEEPVRHMTVYPKLKEPESSYPENPYKPNPGYIDLTE